MTESDKDHLFHDNVMKAVNIQIAKLLSLNFADQMIHLFGLAAASLMTNPDHDKKKLVFSQLFHSPWASAIHYEEQYQASMQQISELLPIMDIESMVLVNWMSLTTPSTQVTYESPGAISRLHSTSSSVLEHYCQNKNDLRHYLITAFDTLKIMSDALKKRIKCYYE